MKACRWIGFALLFMVMENSVLAAPADEAQKRQQLDEVVVSTSRTEVPVRDAPQSVTVLTREEIMASPFARLEDIVRSVPGVSNFRHYGLQTNGIVSP
ncbi:MAG TPA: TonB-dependent receptor plug domain-containing protein, partial [Desulfobacterales bacterium]|nr:TonB-dependent receptor plug domain-containing protein [Desulfobacterales bacterium]